MKLDRRHFVAASVGASATLLAGGMSGGSASAAVPSRRRLVKTAEGTLRGYETPRLAVFKGVHYGEDTSLTRFQPPVPVKPWTGVRDALALGSPCYQQNIDPPAWQDPQPESEDCLVLNIWAPKEARNVPVMVWIHGGAFLWGSGGVPAYDGTALAERGDVIVVTVNHRLNAFGYLYMGAVSPEFEQSANLGQRDLVEALRWVQRNIAAFGGDPDNVTIFGESGGGCKVSTLLAMPSAEGLFKRAIVQSGSMVEFRTREAAEKEARAVLALLGVDAKDAASLKRIDPLKLKAAYVRHLENTGLPVALGRMPFGPVADGEIVPFQPEDPRALALWADVPLLVGTTREEAVWFLSLGGTIPTLPDDGQLVSAINSTFGNIGKARAEALVAAYRRHRPGIDRQHLLVDIGSAIWMIDNAVRQADMKAAMGAAPAYFYSFDWKEPFMGGLWALHGGEVGFIFGTQDLPTIVEANSNIVEKRKQHYTSEQWHGVRDAMMDSWLNFARTGEPANAHIPSWPAYTLMDRAYMQLDTVSSPGHDPLPADIRVLLHG